MRHGLPHPILPNQSVDSSTYKALADMPVLSTHAPGALQQLRPHLKDSRTMSIKDVPESRVALERCKEEVLVYAAGRVTARYPK